MTQKKNEDEHQSIWKVLNSNLVILIIGALLTFFGTTYLTNVYQQKSWKNEKACELWKNELSQTQELINNITNLIKKRYYYSVLIISTDISDPQFNDYYTSYRLSVIEWNTEVTTLRDNSAYLMSDEIAYELLDKDNGREQDGCLHCIFKEFNNVINLKLSNYNKYLEYMNKHELSKNTGDACDKVIFKMNQEFRIKYQKYYQMIGIYSNKQGR